MKDRLFLTGCTGFLGGHLASRASPHWEVHASYRTQTAGCGGVKWVRADLTDAASIEEALVRIRPRAVIHAAARSDIDACETDRAGALAVNTDASVAMARACRGLGARFVFVSSDMVYDGERGMYGEDDEARPVNFYGETKRLAERGVLDAHPEAVCCRSALIYGLPAPGGASFFSRGLEALRSGRPVTLFDDQFRTPVAVQNLADALIELAASGARGLLNLGGSERISRYAFGLKTAEVFGIDPSLVRRSSMNDVRPAAPRPRDVSMSTAKAEVLLETRLLDCGEGLRLVRDGRPGTGGSGKNSISRKKNI
jgi:dTDP-4-dehydrorhamnose reductase